MRWAEFFVESAAMEIMAYRQTQDSDIGVLAEKNENAVLREGRLNPSDRIYRILEYIKKLRTNGRGVPTRSDGSLCISAIYVGAGVVAKRWPTPNDELQICEQALRELGGDLFVGSALPGFEVAWLAGQSRKETWPSIAHMLTACYLVVAAYSGMRDSEVTSLRRRCLVIERGNENQIRRYKVQGTIFKREGLLGKRHTWVVIAPVAKALGTCSTWGDDGLAL
jgi:hypothetical protein